MKFWDKMFAKIGTILYPDEEDQAPVACPGKSDDSTQKFVPPPVVKKNMSRSDTTYLSEVAEEDGDKWWNFPGHPDAATSEESPCDYFTSANIVERIDLQISQGEPPVFTIPSSVMEALALLSKKDFEYCEVAAVIEKNPTLTGIFLSSINSSFYNRGYAVTELRTALSRLGKNNIRALLQLYSIKVTFANDELFGRIAQSIISHSYIVAIVASYLSQRYYPEPSLAFLAGLLHDVGKLGILKTMSMEPDFVVQLKEHLNEHMFNTVFDQRHAQVGVMLGKSWNMDRISLAAIERHHNVWNYSFEDSDQLDYQLCMLINLSDKIARILGQGRPIGKTNIFLEPAAVELNLEKNAGTVEFLDRIQEIVKYKAESNIF